MPKKGERSWNDEQLRDAVASSTTYVDVCRKLGLSPRGRNHERVRDRVRALTLDTSHFLIDRPFADAALHGAVQRCTSHVMVVEHLGLESNEVNVTRVRRRITALGISTAHFIRTRDNTRHRTRWSDDDLRAAVAGSHGLASTIRALGLIPAGGNYNHVHRRIAELGIDTSHFRGQGWNKGEFTPRPARPLDQLLVANRWTTTYHLKRRLIRSGLKKEACELCGWGERRSFDGVVPVELDHINGDKTDNRIENLRILCPNCHALQRTHRGLNKKTRRV